MKKPIKNSLLLTLVLFASKTQHGFGEIVKLTGKRILGIIPQFSTATTITAPDSSTVAATIASAYLTLKDKEGNSLIEQFPLSQLLAMMQYGDPTPFDLTEVDWNRSYVETREAFTLNETILFNVFFE